MIKLKKLLKEHVWDRKFGESLPTLEDVAEKHQTEEKETISERRYIQPEDAGREINFALDGLTRALKKVRNPEKWAEKYHRSLPDLIDMMYRTQKVLGKMK